MKQRIYQIDAFTNEVFSGNPAAVCLLAEWLNDDIMQKIAMENNLAETAFVVKTNDTYHIRWFTPSVEVDLCGHATLAAAFMLFNHENYTERTINFHSPRSGSLSVTKKDELLTLDFPVDIFHSVDLSERLTNAFDITPQFAFKGKTDYLFVFDNESQIKKIIPNLDIISRLDGRGIIITAKGDQVDFVSRFFAPQSGINEDPVTGSAHTTLTPYWAKVLGKDNLSAIQLSERKGYLQCKLNSDRVEISGQAKTYLIGDIYI